MKHIKLLSNYIQNIFFQVTLIHVWLIVVKIDLHKEILYKPLKKNFIYADIKLHIYTLFDSTICLPLSTCHDQVMTKFSNIVCVPHTTQLNRYMNSDDKDV